ncbi:MAG: hypothetical protein FGM46_02430, partial [Ferruginibacter sp.]|nr:hypothetical protein [Ferruginibacter sp.]
MFTVTAQSNNGLVSGPWAGNIELRTAVIWAEVSPSVKSVSVTFHPVNNPKKTKTIKYKGELGKDFNPVKIELNGLDIETQFTYQLLLNEKSISTPYPLYFNTKPLWQHRKPATDFSFLAGSCAYFNEPIY